VIIEDTKQPAIAVWLGILLVVLGALSSAASIALPFSLWGHEGKPAWLLQIVGLCLLCLSLNRAASLRQAVMLALIYSVVWLSTTFWWLYVAMHTYAGLHGVLAVAAVLWLAMALSLCYALAGGIFWCLKGVKRNTESSILFAAVWTVAELARGTFLTGFGWGAVGYAHIDGPLGWYAPWVGVYGVGALAACTAMVLVQMGLKTVRLQLIVIVMFGLPWVASSAANEWTSPSGTLTVSLLQGNIPQGEKFETSAGIPMALKWYAEQLQISKSQLVVTPETAIPVLPQQLPEAYWRRLGERFSEGKQAALIGIPLGNFKEGYTNSVVGLQAGSEPAWRYDKQHLVPFGEFIPPFFKWFTAMMNIPLGDFNRGGLGQAPFGVAGQRLGLNICYEDLFGEELAMRFLEESQSPTVFVNVSNIGWFGNTVAIDQHLNISRMRALEFQRPFIRATNTGATAIVDHHAKIIASLPRHTRGVLTGTVEGRTGITPYAWWVSRFGLMPLWLASVAGVLWVWQRRHLALASGSCLR
jgi:apolipoprotein N-acyltransferase